MGIDIDIVNEIFKRANIEVDSKIATFNGSLKLIKEGLADMLPAITSNEERDSIMDYCSCRDGVDYVFFTSSNSTVEINSYEDLYKYSIGIIDGYEYTKEFKTDTKIRKDINIEESLMFKKLTLGQLDALIINDYTGSYYIKNNNIENQVRKQNFKLKGEGIDSKIGFCKAKDLSEYMKIYEDGISSLKKDGTLDKIVAKYI